IYRHVSQVGDITTTAAVNALDYHARFTALSPHYDAVIHINLGAGFSSCHQNARLAASDFTNVFAVDSQNLSGGQGHVVLEAARLSETGHAPEEILAGLDQFIPRVDTSFLLSQLEYLRKGGRCSSVAALGANLLKLKPCIEVRDGAMHVGKKYRGAYEKALLEYTRDRLSGCSGLDPHRTMVVRTACPPSVTEAVCREVEAITGSCPFTTFYTGCTISSHCGPCTLGISSVRI
ncbi:MAG: DegV family EDD domain-containing protein, partial [Clostridiales bacterium]|nr:DegV family EDD domain-containing protein [Clostridiales bacterium]